MGYSVRETLDCGRWESAGCGWGVGGVGGVGGVDGAGCGGGLGGAGDWIGDVTGPSARSDGHQGGVSLPFFTWRRSVDIIGPKAELEAGCGGHIAGTAGQDAPEPPPPAGGGWVVGWLGGWLGGWVAPEATVPPSACLRRIAGSGYR
jgi:hypothetical protein